MLIHDTSKVIARHALKLLNVNQFEDPTRPGKRMSALPVITIGFSDSKDEPQLQLADWVAGAGRQWADELIEKKGDRFSRHLGPLVKEWLIGALWPDPDTIENPSPRTLP
jgi:hypothetical protein